MARLGYRKNFDCILKVVRSRIACAAYPVVSAVAKAFFSLASST